MASPKKFTLNLKGYSKTVGANSVNTVRKAAKAVLERVVRYTPVKTGAARSNWLVRLDRSPTHTVLPIDKTGDGAIAKGNAKIDNYRFTEHRGIFIKNNLPYIEDLNNGSSKQAPAGFVEKAMASGRRKVSGTKLLKK